MQNNEEQSKDDSLNIGVNLGINATIESLIKLGVLVELDGGGGYNGITNPKGISVKILTDEIDDFVHEELETFVKAGLEQIMDEANDIINGALS